MLWEVAPDADVAYFCKNRSLRESCPAAGSLELDGT